MITRRSNVSSKNGPETPCVALRIHSRANAHTGITSRSLHSYGIRVTRHTGSYCAPHITRPSSSSQSPSRGRVSDGARIAFPYGKNRFFARAHGAKTVEVTAQEDGRVYGSLPSVPRRIRRRVKRNVRRRRDRVFRARRCESGVRPALLSCRRSRAAVRSVLGRFRSPVFATRDRVSAMAISVVPVVERRFTADRGRRGGAFETPTERARR